MRVRGLIKDIGRCNFRSSTESRQSLAGSRKAGFDPKRLSGSAPKRSVVRPKATSMVASGTARIAKTEYSPTFHDPSFTWILVLVCHSGIPAFLRPSAQRSIADLSRRFLLARRLYSEIVYFGLWRNRSATAFLASSGGPSSPNARTRLSRQRTSPGVFLSVRPKSC